MRSNGVGIGFFSKEAMISTLCDHIESSKHEELFEALQYAASGKLSDDCSRIRRIRDSIVRLLENKPNSVQSALKTIIVYDILSQEKSNEY